MCMYYLVSQSIYEGTTRVQEKVEERVATAAGHHGNRHSIWAIKEKHEMNMRHAVQGRATKWTLGWLFGSSCLYLHRMPSG